MGKVVIGGPGRDRTDDLFHAMEARSQLRHRPTLKEGSATILAQQYSLVKHRWLCDHFQCSRNSFPEWRLGCQTCENEYSENEETTHELYLASGMLWSSTPDCLDIFHPDCVRKLGDAGFLLFDFRTQSDSRQP